MPQIETSRLWIRAISLDDATFLSELMNTPKWHQNIGDRNINSSNDAIAYIKTNMHADIAVKGFVNHVIIVKTTGEQVGTCSLHDRSWVDGMDIGYALLPQHEGNGYAKEAAEAMVKLAFEKHEQSKVSGITNVDNTASQKVLTSLGFVYKASIPTDKDEKVALFTMTHEKWSTKV